MRSKITCFEDLEVWQNAQDLAVKIYTLVEENDLIRHDFGLKNQFRTAVLSISDNIAEGFEYSNSGDFHRYLRISKGSCGEVRNKIHFAIRMKFIPEDVALTLLAELKMLGAQLGALIKKVKTYKKPVAFNSLR